MGEALCDVLHHYCLYFYKIIIDLISEYCLKLYTDWSQISEHLEAMDDKIGINMQMYFDYSI